MRGRTPGGADNNRSLHLKTAGFPVSEQMECDGNREGRKTNVFQQHSAPGSRKLNVGASPHRAKDKSASGEKAKSNCKTISNTTLNLAGSLKVQQTIAIGNTVKPEAQPESSRGKPDGILSRTPCRCRPLLWV
jgi:hypothetical protein